MSLWALSSMRATARRSNNGVLSLRSSMVGSSSAVLGKVVRMAAAKYRCTAPATKGLFEACRLVAAFAQM